MPDMVRVEDYYWEKVLADSNRAIGVLEGVQDSGSLTGNVHADIRWSGKLTISRDLDIDWNNVRLAPTVVVDGVKHRLGVHLVKPVGDTYDTFQHEMTLNTYDKTLIPHEDLAENTHAVQANKVLTSEVLTLLRSTGETQASITRSNAMTRGSQVWEPGTSKLTIINGLLTAANYFALWCDRAGNYRVEPYRDPNSRPVVYSFDSHRDAIHLVHREATRKTTIPNRVVAISREGEDNKSLRAVATNDDPNSPWSFQSQGRWVKRVETGVEAASQAVLDAYAERLLKSGQSASTVHTRKMAFFPFDLNDIVEFDGKREVIENVDITMEPGELMTVKSRVLE